MEVFGNSVRYGIGSLTFNADGTFKDYIGAMSSEFDDDTEGNYTISKNAITLNCKSNKKKI